MQQSFRFRGKTYQNEKSYLEAKERRRLTLEKRQLKKEEYSERKKLREEKRKEKEQRIKERVNSEPSMGERKVINYLTKHNIYFIREYYTKGLKVGGQNLFIDFFCPDLKLVIEFDGIHHYQPVYGLKKFQAQQRMDKFKDAYCEKRKWTMVRISYQDMRVVDSILNERISLLGKDSF